MENHEPPSAAIKTLGCKLNQFESQLIRQALSRLGCRIVPFESHADIYVINTCTVTSRTDRDCRRLIRRAKRLNAKAFVAVTGCYAEVSPGVLEAMPEADLVASNSEKATLAQQIKQRLSDALPWPAIGETGPVEDYACGGELLDSFAGHTRAFVKVQEGCDAHCAYCIIPRARGPSRSVPPEVVRAQVERLAAAGHPEVVLIGIHLGKYGNDLTGAPDLAGLTESLCELPQLQRLRLSSIEPREVPGHLIELVTGHPKVCRHFHIPMQSGCDTVLRRMGRPYDARFYADLVHQIHDTEPRTCLGADVMVGFPGETEEESEETRALLADLPLSYLHVFTYSAREGTRAAEMPGQLNHETKIARNHELRELSEAKRSRFAQTLVGATLGTVLERPAPDHQGVLEGVTDNYMRIQVEGPTELLGTIQPVRVLTAEGERLLGRLVKNA